MEAKEILEAYRAGKLTDTAVLAALQEKYREETLHLGFASLDLDRAGRCGFPEVVFCAGKTEGLCVEFLSALMKKYDNVIGTRADAGIYDRLKNKIPHVLYDSTAAMIYQHKDNRIRNGERTIAVITAGTGDIPVAEEAALTAEIMGNRVRRIYDVGVAGLHRLLARQGEIRAANVCVVVAGMEGALASVVGGLVDKPVIAVPTSIGYGANFHGLSALLSMLNSCAAGVSVVNIDNGFGAGRLAAMINEMR